MKKILEETNVEFRDESNKKEELESKEVNVYGLKCGELKIHCMYDCFGDTPWLTTAK